MKKNIVVILAILFVTSFSYAQKNKWAALLTATNSYMHEHLWNAQNHNYARRADRREAPGSDAWGITIELDAMAYMIDAGISKPNDLKDYFLYSALLYERTNGNSGARILARQGDKIYIGGDDDLQWCAALVHCFLATKDSTYLNAATSSFKALVDMNFWQEDGAAKGWSWNSSDRRPNGVSTAYGALAAARLYQATKDNIYKQWTAASLNALRTPQVGFFPRDMMVAASAAMTVYEITKDPAYKKRAMELEDSAVAGGSSLLAHEGTGERNPTDIGDLADGLYYFYKVTHSGKYKTLAEKFITFFVAHRTLADITDHGFYSRYDTKGSPILTGSYLGVPCSVPFLPEVAEMEKLLAIAYYTK